MIEQREQIGDEIGVRIARHMRAIGFAVATLARSQLAGIGIGIALYFGEAFAGIFLADIVRYLPFSAAGSAVGIGEAFGDAPSPLSQETAMIVVGLWLIGSLVMLGTKKLSAGDKKRRAVA